MTKPEFISVEMGTRVTAHALHVGDRINTMGFEGEALSAVPLAVRTVGGCDVMFCVVRTFVCDSPGAMYSPMADVQVPPCQHT